MHNGLWGFSSIPNIIVNGFLAASIITQSLDEKKPDDNGADDDDEKDDDEDDNDDDEDDYNEDNDNSDDYDDSDDGVYESSNCVFIMQKCFYTHEHSKILRQLLVFIFAFKYDVLLHSWGSSLWCYGHMLSPLFRPCCVRQKIWCYKKIGGL